MNQSFVVESEMSSSFVPNQIFECGQVFRFKRLNEDNILQKYQIVSKDKIAIVAQNEDNSYNIMSNDKEYFKNYFDLKTDYQRIKVLLCKNNNLMENAIKFGNGIRILKQDKFEMLISFIISSCNNISRIKSIIERLSVNLGEEKQFCGQTYFAFPTVEQMACKNKAFYEMQGLGFRAKYVANAVNKICDGFDLQSLDNMETDEARHKLMQFDGVGRKVADCVLLFAYGRTDVFPVDVWIKKVYNDYFAVGQAKNTKISAENISRFLVDNFKDLSGYAQQYLFYYKREM